MNERRPMSQALRTAELPPGAMDFIKAGTPRPMNPTALAEPPSPVAELRPASLARKETPVMASDSVPTDAEPLPIKPNRPRSMREPELEVMPLRNLVNLSIRVRPEIPDALLRASTERKLKRLKAHTQQEIAAEALTQWLTRHGYLPA